MKNDEKKSPRKLQLNRTTLRRLDRDELGQAQGGLINVSLFGGCISPKCTTLPTQADCTMPPPKSI